MSSHETVDATGLEFSLEWVDKRIVLAASIVGVLVALNALMVPLLARLGGGVVAGFVAAYAAGRLQSGLAHALLASAITGAVMGAITGLLGAIGGLYNEPVLLVFSDVGPVSPMVAGLGLPTLVLIVMAFTALVAVDGLVGAVIGIGVRTLVPW